MALKDVADRQGLSKKYLEQVVAPLASAGLLDVTRGNQGGYRLAREAASITLADIVAASEDGLELLDCMGSLSTCERSRGCPSRRVWGGLQAAIGGLPLGADSRRRRRSRRWFQLVISQLPSFAYHV